MDMGQHCKHFHNEVLKFQGEYPFNMFNILNFLPTNIWAIKMLIDSSVYTSFLMKPHMQVFVINELPIGISDYSC